MYFPVHHGLKGWFKISVQNSFWINHLKPENVRWLFAAKYLLENSLLPYQLLLSLGQSAYPRQLRLFQSPQFEGSRLSWWGRCRSRSLRHLVTLQDTAEMNAGPQLPLPFSLSGMSFSQSVGWHHPHSGQVLHGMALPTFRVDLVWYGKGWVFPIQLNLSEKSLFIDMPRDVFPINPIELTKISSHLHSW